MEPIQLTLSNLGAFPSIQKPKVIWIDVFPKDQLLKIFKTIESICISEGFEADQKSFKTHITLARLKRGTSSEKIKQISSLLKISPSIPPVEFNLNGVTIFQSVLTPQGPLYTALRFIH